MNKIILDSPEYTIVTTDNKVYIIGNDGDSYSIIPKGLIDDMAKNLGLYDRYDILTKEINDKIGKLERIIEERNKTIMALQSIINDRNSIIRNLKRDKEKAINEGSKDDTSGIRKKIFGKDLVLVEYTGNPHGLCSKCSISKECNLYYSNKYKGFDKEAISLITACVSEYNKYIKYAKEITDETISEKKEC